jgi:hypothetical protein
LSKAQYALNQILNTRSYLKNVFWPHIFVGASFQILDNPRVACGFKLGPAAIWNQNPIFEMASNYQLLASGLRLLAVKSSLDQY